MIRRQTQNLGMEQGSTPLLLDALGVARTLGVCRRSVYNMHQDGTLGPLPIRLGKNTRWRSAEIARWVQAGCPRRELWLEMEQS